MMAPKTVFVGLFMAAVLPAALGQTVSLRAEIPYNAHGCVRDCLQYIVDNGKDVGGALDCGGPYQEDCFCPTADDSLTVVSQHLNNCASSSCSRGDLTKDISSMRSYYASYCGDKGYKQDAIDGWYNAASGPSEADATTTADDDTASKTTDAAQSEQNETQAPETTTEVAVSTQTRDVIGSELGDGASMSRVVVRLTSTLWVDNTAAPGSPDANQTDKGSGVNTTALGAGLGVGIPLVLALLGVGLWFLLRQRRRKAAAAAAAAAPSSTDQQVQRPPPYVPHDTPASNKAEAMPMVAEVHQDKTELGGGQGVRRELAGQQIHPFPEQTVSPAVSVPGHHEMMVENRPHEMQAGNNHQHYYSSPVPDRHELPGQHHY